MLRQIRVLLMDDSIIFRELLIKEATREPNIEKFICAKDPFEALYKINKYRPDVMLCNIELLIKHGMEYIHKLLREQPIPTIAIASRHELKQSVIHAGAVSFVYRPKTATHTEVAAFINKLLTLAVYHSHAKSYAHVSPLSHRSSKVIAIGAARGGTEAIVSVLSAMPSNCPPILIAHHAPLGDSAMFVERLKYSCSMMVKQAEHGDPLRPGLALVAPASSHMLLACEKEQYKVECVVDEPYELDTPDNPKYKPSLDLFFRSVAQTMEQKAIGILLNGSGPDGINGLLQMTKAGAITLAQNDYDGNGTAAAAFRSGAVDKLIPLDQAAKEILMAL